MSFRIARIKKLFRIICNSKFWNEHP